MCGIDGRVTKEVSKREVRDADGFWGCCLGVDSPTVEEFTVFVNASLVTDASVKSKVFWGSLLRSQTG
jgi:hypothetical protein